MLLIDQIAYQNKFLDYSPYKKGFFYLCVLVGCLISPLTVQLGIMVSVATLTIYATNLSIKRYCKWFIIPFPFLLMSVITILLTFSHSSNQMVYYFSLKTWYIGVSSSSIQTASHLFVRSLSCLVCTYFFMFTVPFQQIIKVMKRVKLPTLMIEITMLMYRFIFIFIEETLQIYHSQQIRFGYCGLKNSYHSLGRLGKVLMIQMLDCYKQMTTSLEMKFYHGEFPIEE